jgi:hypothetical protein
MLLLTSATDMVLDCIGGVTPRDMPSLCDVQCERAVEDLPNDDNESSNNDFATYTKSTLKCNLSNSSC